MEVLVLQVPDARTAHLAGLLAEDRADALRARIVIAVDGRRCRTLKDNLGPKVLKVKYRAQGALVQPCERDDRQTA